MNLGDPELELIDPTPNIYNLFIQFDKQFFWAKLASRAIVRWSKRMYSCAGVCSYEGSGGICNIALSEPLLKLRPRKNLVETLLHEMIHAYLFITCRDNDRDGHGPNFQAHMHRINKSAGVKITIYHDFHDEVKLYQNHVWRCNGPCQNRRPHFGIVRRTCNRAPGKSDYWWESHRRSCGGTFIKIKEPDKPIKVNTKKVPPKSNGDISKYIITEKTVNNIPQNVPTRSVLKDSNILPIKSKINGGNTLVITKKGPVYNPQVINTKSVNGRPRSNSLGVVETVRSVWANKQLPTNPIATINNKQPIKPNAILNNTISTPNKATKHKIESNNNNPPAKMQKIDDYFKTTATSVLKDIYGKDFQITQKNVNSKIVAIADSNTKQKNNPVVLEVPTPKIKSLMPNKPSIETEPKPLINNPIVSATNLVDCPVCKAKVDNLDINRHLDECLNKEVLETLCKDNQAAGIPTHPPISIKKSTKKELREIVGVIPTIPEYFSVEISDNITNEMLASVSDSIVCPPINDSDNTAKVQEELNTAVMVLDDDIKKESEDSETFDPNDIKKVKAIVKKINYEKDFENFKKKILEDGKKFQVATKQEKPNNVDFGYLPSFLDEVACKIDTPKIKIQPGTSKDIVVQIGHVCACCGKNIDKSIEEHLDECLAFFENNNTIPNEVASTSFANETIVIDDDDDDIFDETQTFNATGTKLPCPCCLTMIEEADMNSHLDSCLSENVLKE